MQNYIKSKSELCIKNSTIDNELYKKYDVKRGLRDVNGNGVLTGLTEISDIRSFEYVDGVKTPCNGKLSYRGYDIKDLINGISCDSRFGFEETAYLLLFGELPTQSELTEFEGVLSSYRTLPKSFVRDIIMKAPSTDMMNSLARSVLTLYTYDDNANDISIENVLRQCLQLIARFPLLAVYGYQAHKYYHGEQSLFIHVPDKQLSTAENILHLLRDDSKYTALEAKVLDLALILHAEHGGGNNSSFTTHVVTSSGTDTYSAVAAALGSLKGPRHGGANIKVVQMFDNIKENVDIKDKAALKDYLVKILDKEAFDKSGLIYGMGHAVYSVSDPRAEVLKKCAKDLSVEKNCTDEFELYETVAELATEIIAEKRKIYKGVSPNVDFYSGFVYRILGLPCELFTPIFAVARIAGWSAHRIEEIENAGKIIRPAYLGVKPKGKYIPLEERRTL